MEDLINLAGLTPEQANLMIAGIIAGLVIKLPEVAVKLLGKIAKRTKNKIDDDLVQAIADAIAAKK